MRSGGGPRSHSGKANAAAAMVGKKKKESEKKRLTPLFKRKRESIV